MKIAISATGPNLDAQVDSRLGRCQYFIIVDPETMEFEGIQNTSVGAMHGAGIQTAQLIASKGAKVVLTGNSGPNAFQTLSAAGIQVIVGVSGKIREVIERYKKGEFQSTNQASVSSHFGTGGSSSFGTGMGGGRGMGRGGGMGMGQGRGMGQGMMGEGLQTPYGPGTSPGAAPQTPKEQELQFLKNQTQALKEQLEQIDKRIKELKKNS